MSDPFEALAQLHSDPAAPDVRAIRARARRIRARRNAAMGMSTGAVLIIALVVAVSSIGSLPPSADTARESAVEAPRDEGVEPPPQSTTTLESSEALPDFSAQRAADTAAGSASGSPEQASRRDGLQVQLEVGATTVEPGEGTALTIVACNTRQTTVERAFPTAQRYDFEVTNHGRLVWRWSDGRMFAQTAGTERWEPGECKRYEEHWDATDGDGRPVRRDTYQVTAILKTSEPVNSEQRTVCVSRCP